jgi:hypothetical protein
LYKEWKAKYASDYKKIIEKNVMPENNCDIGLKKVKLKDLINAKCAIRMNIELTRII